MPVYNGAPYVEQAIRSLLRQTEPSFVILISDDCSADETPQICARLAAEDARVKFEGQAAHLGMTRNFLYVLQEASSPYFMWAAQDDWWAPQFLSETLGLLRRSPDAVGCAVGLQGFIPATGLSWQVRVPAGLSHPSPTVRARAVFRSAGWHAYYGLYRRDALKIEEPVLHDVHFIDGLFVFRMALRGRFVASSLTLRIFRDIDQQAKAIGHEAHLYSGRFSAASRLMWRYTGKANLSRSQVISLRGYILWKWLTFTRDWAARVNLERGSRAWKGGRYPELALILMKQLLLRPSDLFNQAMRQLKLVLFAD